jgi:beta-lactam-binding protein with PASTA domain
MAGAGYWVFSEAVAGGTYEIVPNVVGMEWIDANRRIEAAGLNVGEDNFVRNDEWPEYTVIGQRPQAGNVVREGRPVNLTISRGEEFNAVENYVGIALTAVEEAVSSNDFEIVSIARIPHSAPYGTVLAQDPPATGEKASTNHLRLLVSDGVGGDELRMPDLRNKPIIDAMAELARMPVVTNRVSQFGEDDPVDVVLSQMPAPGAPLTPNMQVELRYRPGDEELAEEDAEEEMPETAADDTIKVTVDYTVPHSWFDREVRIDVVGSNGVRQTVFPTRDLYVNGAPPKYESGITIKQPLEYRERMTVEVFLDGRLARTYRYGPNGEGSVQDSGI